jgi:uncharacterized membrane protein
MSFLENIAFGIGMIGMMVVLWGVLKGLVAFLVTEITRFKADGVKPQSIAPLEKIHRGIGFDLLLGLEFLIAADIVRTIIEPTLEELAILGIIVGIRITLSYFLGKEIGHPGNKV